MLVARDAVTIAPAARKAPWLAQLGPDIKRNGVKVKLGGAAVSIGGASLPDAVRFSGGERAWRRWWTAQRQSSPPHTPSLPCPSHHIPSAHRCVSVRRTCPIDPICGIISPVLVLKDCQP
jgi:hypothetical protein